MTIATRPFLCFYKIIIFSIAASESCTETNYFITPNLFAMDIVSIRSTVRLVTSIMRGLLLSGSIVTSSWSGWIESRSLQEKDILKVHLWRSIVKERSPPNFLHSYWLMFILKSELIASSWCIIGADYNSTTITSIFASSWSLYSPKSTSSSFCTRSRTWLLR